MPNWLQGNTIQLLILFLFFGFSALTWVARKLKEQAEIRRRQQIIERQKLEALRTGRVETGPATAVGQAQSPERRLAEMAARRAEQMRQGGLVPSSTQVRAPTARMPQSTRAPQRGATQVPAPRPVRPVPGAGPSPRPPARAPVPAQRGSPTQRRQEMLDARRRALEARARAQQPQPRPVPAQPVLSASAPAARATESDAAPVAATRLHLDHAGLRRAIVLKEILDPPISLREDQL